MIASRLVLTLAIACGLAACGEPHQRTNEVRIGIALEPPNLDPTAGAAAAIDEVVYSNVFEGLTRIGEHGEVLPALATHWDISPDRMTYSFYLRPATFHDGTSFDAADVKFSLDRARAPESTNAQKALFEPIADVTVIDPATVKVTLSRPTSDFLFNMGLGDAVIVAPESAATNASKPIGTGPFKFSRWLKGTQIELVRRPNAPTQSPLGPDKLVFLIIPDPSAAYAALIAGDVDSFPNFPAPELLPQIKDDPRFTIAIGTTEGETILAINNARPPFDDIRVRRAISHAINRKDLIDGVGQGYGTPIGSHFAPHNKAYIDLTGRYPFDPAKARELLAEAGHANGITATLKLPPVVYARRGGEVIAAELKAVGINVKIENIEWAQWLDQVFKRGDFDLTIVSHTEPNDIGIYARDDYYFHYAKPAFKALMTALADAQTEDERDNILRDAQRMLADDAVNAFLFQLPKIGVWNARLKGQWLNAPVQANDMTKAYWVKK